MISILHFPNLSTTKAKTLQAAHPLGLLNGVQYELATPREVFEAP